MKEPWEVTLTEWLCLPHMYGNSPYWKEFHRAIAANATFGEAVAAASRLKSNSKPAHVWTDADKDVVRTEYDGTMKSLPVLAKKIGVTRKAVTAKINKLKLGNQVHRKWTDADKDVVRTEYDGTRASVEAIAAKLKRTPIAVKGQVQSLKLTKAEHRDWTDEDLKYLRDSYGVIPDGEICEHLHRSLNSIVLAAKRHLKINRKMNFYTARDVAKALAVSDSKIIFVPIILPKM